MDIRFLDEQDRKEIDQELDSLKQSGVESNEILVDALNSKKVSASTNDTIKINVNKVKDIKVGDYSVGDEIAENKLEPQQLKYHGIITDDVGTNKTGTKQVRIDSKGNIIITDTINSNSRIRKISPSGNVLWTYNAPADVFNTTIDNDDNIIMFIWQTGLHKLSPNGAVQWTYSNQSDSGSNYIRSITVDKYNNIYISYRSTYKIHKISPKGEKVFFQGLYNVYENSYILAHGDFLYAARASDYMSINKLDLNTLKEVDSYRNREEASAGGDISVDKYGMIYHQVTGATLYQIDFGEGVRWSTGSIDFAINEHGDTYIATSYRFQKVDKEGIEKWRVETEPHGTDIYLRDDYLYWLQDPWINGKGNILHKYDANIKYKIIK